MYGVCVIMYLSCEIVTSMDNTCLTLHSYHFLCGENNSDLSPPFHSTATPTVIESRAYFSELKLGRILWHTTSTRLSL